MQNEKRTKGNAKWLFKTDPHDGWKRKIPKMGSFGIRNIPELGLKNNYHIGTDYGANIGEEVTAYDDGVVISTSGHADYGKQVFIYFTKIDKTGHYAHLNKIFVKPGQAVKAQEVIGESGNTGKSGGPHLHFGFAEGKISNTSKSHRWIDFENYSYPKNSSSNKKQYINLKPIKQYGIYKLGVEPVAKNITHYLQPQNFGGLSYKIEDTTKYPDVFIISTRDFGKVQIYHDSTRATITESPEYAVKTPDKNSQPKPEKKPAQKPKPKPKPKPKNDIGKNWTPNKVPLSLYPKSTGGTSYAPSKTKRTYKILDEANGRIQIQNKYFSSPGNKVWVNKSDGAVSGKGSSAPKYVNFKPNTTAYKLRYANDTSRFFPGTFNPSKFGGASLRIVKDLGNNYYQVTCKLFNPNVVSVLVDSRWSNVSVSPKYKVLD